MVDSNRVNVGRINLERVSSDDYESKVAELLGDDQPQIALDE